MPCKTSAINLSEPLETVLLAALRLPRGKVADEVIVQALRRLYELAHGRLVVTPIGSIPIAPPLAPQLATAHLEAATRCELLALVEVMVGSTGRKWQDVRSPSFRAGSALFGCLNGRLGAPEFLADGYRPRAQQEPAATTSAR